MATNPTSESSPLSLEELLAGGDNTFNPNVFGGISHFEDGEIPYKVLEEHQADKILSQSEGLRNSLSDQQLQPNCQTLNSILRDAHTWYTSWINFHYANHSPGEIIQIQTKDNNGAEAFGIVTEVAKQLQGGTYEPMQIHNLPQAFYTKAGLIKLLEGEIAKIEEERKSSATHTKGPNLEEYHVSQLQKKISLEQAITQIKEVGFDTLKEQARQDRSLRAQQRQQDLEVLMANYPEGFDVGQLPILAKQIHELIPKAKTRNLNPLKRKKRSKVA